MFKINLSALLLAALAVHPSAQAAYSWNFTNATSNSASDASKPNITASSTAFSTNNAGAAGTGNGSAGTVFVNATASPYSNGIGIDNADEAVGTAPEAIDNALGTDAVLFTFRDGSNNNMAVALNSVTIGWRQTKTDADISVLAYTGSGTATVAGYSISDLLNNGWTFIGHYADLSMNTVKTINTGNTPTTSAYWLISAYNPSYGSPTSNNLDINNDYFKVSKLGGAYTPPPPTSGNNVPEPSSLLLLSFALMGWRFIAGDHRLSRPRYS